MVVKVCGLDDKGKVVFERPARDYDKRIAESVFGVTLGDCLKAASVITVGILIYANQQNFNKTIMESVAQVSFNTNENAKAISGVKDALNNLNNYLSSSTGKQFKDGRPIQ